MGWRRLLHYRIPAGALLATAVVFLLPDAMTLASRVAVGWLVFVAVQIAIILRTLGVRHPAELRAWAPEVNPRRSSFAVFLIASAAVSVLASVAVLRVADQQPETIRLLHLGLGAATVMVTWFAVQATFAVRYACMYYGDIDRAAESGLDFPDEEDPDFWDFLYFATCAGMTFEASDVRVTHRPFRRWLTFHAIFSFVFTSINLALLVDIAANLV